jgi:hypothetical protein
MNNRGSADLGGGASYRSPYLKPKAEFPTRARQYLARAERTALEFLLWGLSQQPPTDCLSALRARPKISRLRLWIKGRPTFHRHLDEVHSILHRCDVFRFGLRDLDSKRFHARNNGQMLSGLCTAGYIWRYFRVAGSGSL